MKDSDYVFNCKFSPISDYIGMFTDYYDDNLFFEFNINEKGEFIGDSFYFNHNALNVTKIEFNSELNKYEYKKYYVLFYSVYYFSKLKELLKEKRDNKEAFNLRFKVSLIIDNLFINRNDFIIGDFKNEYDINSLYYRKSLADLNNSVSLIPRKKVLGENSIILESLYIDFLWCDFSKQMYKLHVINFDGEFKLRYRLKSDSKNTLYLR